MLPYGLHLPVFLEDLPRHVEREIVGGHDTAHEAQVGRQQLAPVVHDEDARHVELQAAVNAVTLMEIERSLRRNVEERARLEAALDVDADVLERIVPVVADV